MEHTEQRTEQGAEKGNCDCVAPTGNDQVTAGSRNRVSESETFYRPEADLLESDTHLILQLDVPGSHADRIDVSCADGKLEIRAGVDAKDIPADRKPLLTEYGTGTFTRSFQLGERIDFDAIEATYEDGVLTVRLPKREPKPKQVQVRRVTH